MRTIIDKHIPYIKGVLEPFSDVLYAFPEEITPDLVKNVDCLVIRTRTRVDANLLADSKCRFVATATIGMDHYDMEWCHRAGVTAINSAGCNAPAVAQYVLSSILHLIKNGLNDLTLGIVGVGNVGKIVERWATGLGIRVMKVDPIRQSKEGGREWSTMEDIAQYADIISFHAPLTYNGPYPTYHLADARFFETLKRRPIIINSSRGPVVDNQAWKNAIRNGLVSNSVIDVWEGEPVIDRELMSIVDIATPHIAGYSEDGKIRATTMVLDAVSKHFGLPELRPLARKPVEIPERVSPDKILSSYNPMSDTDYMRRAITEELSEAEIKKIFEHLRDDYPLRQEITI